MSDLNLAIKLTTAGGNVVVKDLREIDSAADKVNHSLTGTGKSGTVAKQGFDQASGGADALTGSLKSMIAQAAGVIALGFGIDKIASGMYDGIDAFQGYRGQLKTITGDFDSASVELERLINLSKETPFTLAQSVEGFSKLTHLGLDPSRESMISYGNTAAAMGKDLMQMIEAVADASVGEFERLKEFGIKASSQGDNVRLTFQGTSTEIKKDAASIQQYLIDLGNNKFGDAMGDQMDRLSAKSSNLETSFDQLYDAIGSYGAADGIGGTIDSIANGVDGLRSNLPEIISTIEALSVVVGGHLVKALVASGNGLIANAIATNTQLQANIKLQASELVLAKTAQHKAVQEQLAAKRSLAMAKNTYTRSRAINSLAAANGRAITTERALTAATISHDTAMKKATVTSRVLGLSMALIGGPVGVAMLGAYALYEMSTGMDTAKTAAEQLEEATGKVTKSIEAMTKAEQQQTAAQYAKLIQTKQAEIVKLNQSIEDYIRRGSQSGSDAAFLQAEQQSKNLEQHKKGLEGLIVAYAKVQGVLFDAGMAGITWNTVISEGTDVTATLSKETQSLVDRLDPLSAKSKQFGAEMHQLHQSYLTGAISLDKYKKLVNLLGGEFKKSTASKKTELRTNQSFIASLAEQNYLLTLNAKQKLLHINLSKLSANATAEDIAAVKALTEAQYEQLKINDQKTSDSDYYQEVIDGANDIGESWTTAGNVIVNTFGTIGEQLDKLAQQQEKYAAKQKKFAVDKIKYADDPKKLAEIGKAEKALAKQKAGNAMSEISSYRAITDSAAQMFSENSKGRQAMQAASDVFTAIEMANSALRIGSYAIEAVAAAFAAPWPIGFASGAAMIAIMAGLGVAVSGGSGSAPMSSEERQQTQGTGTVLGSDDKSASIANSYGRIEELSLDQYAVLREMNTSLHDLNNNITHLATSFVSNFGKFDGDSYGGQLGETSKYNSNGLFEKIDSKLDVVFGSLGGSILDSIIGGFSTKKKSLVDSGISIVSQTMGDIIDSGLVEAQAYFDIKTKKKKFWGLSSSTSYSTEIQDINQQLEHELALIFSDIGSSITGAVDVLGFDITRTLDSFVIDLPNISFKDLSGDEIQAELEAMFSSQADLMATYLVPGLSEFQKVGEGLYETLIRLAQEQAVFNSVLELTGNTLADVDATQTIQATQAIIGYAGSIEALQSAAGTFFNEFFDDGEKFEHMQEQLDAQFSALGFSALELSVLKTKEGFKAMVSALDPLNEADQKLYAQLLLLSGQSAEYYDALEKQGTAVDDTLEKENELAKARKAFTDDIENQLEQLDMSPMQVKLVALQEQFLASFTQAKELGVETGLLEELYARNRQTIIDDALTKVNSTHQSAMDTLTRDHEKAVNDLVNNNGRLVSAFSTLNASIANSILSIRRQGSDWSESNYQTSQVNDLSSLLGQGSVEEQITTIDNLQQAYVNKYNAELAGLNSAIDAEQSAYDAQLANIESRYQAELEVYNGMRSALDSLKEAVDNLLLSDLSTLTNEQRFTESKSQYQTTLAAAKSGDVNAISKLGNAQSNYLSEAQNMYSSSDAYSNIFDKVFAEVSAVSARNVYSPSKQEAPAVPAAITEHNTQVRELQTSTVEKLKELQELSKALEAENQTAFDVAMSDLELQLKTNQTHLIAELHSNTLAVNTQAANDAQALNDALEAQAQATAAQNAQAQQATQNQTNAINKMNTDVVAQLRAVRSQLSAQTQAANARAAQAEQEAEAAQRRADNLERQLAEQARIQERQTDELMVVGENYAN